jgi:hypothetical protein
MVELLVGYYIHAADHSMAAKWRPAPSRPAYAEAVYQASVVSWRSLSDEAVRQKARHFRKTLANAEDQLPPDRPGVIHVGIETYAGADVDFTRHLFNTFEARSFSPKRSRLRWVYANHFVPEATTRKDESWAITETMVPYKIGSHRTRWPLPSHMLVSPESEGRPGVHWERRQTSWLLAALNKRKAWRSTATTSAHEKEREMDLHSDLTVFLVGTAGGGANEMLHWYNLREDPALPAYRKSAFYWGITAAMALLGGLVAWLNFGAGGGAIAIFQIGLATPLILQKLIISTQDRTGAKGATANFYNFIDW